MPVLPLCYLIFWTRMERITQILVILCLRLIYNRYIGVGFVILPFVGCLGFIHFLLP